MSDVFDATTEVADTGGAAGDGPGEIGASTTPERAATASDADLGSLLSEFDRATSKSGEATPSPESPAAPAAPVGVDWSNIRAFSDDQMLALAMETDRQRIIWDSFLQHHQQQVLQQQSREDFNKVVVMADEYLEGLPVPPDFARRWLLAEYSLDPQLQEAWNRRRESHELDAYASSAIKRALKKMRAEAARSPDPAATEDRNLVIAAMRGASGNPPPAETPDAYERRMSRMSQAEFEAEKSKMMSQ